MLCLQQIDVVLRIACRALNQSDIYLSQSESVTIYGDSASVQAVTRVNAEQTSKRTMRRPTRQGYRGRLIRQGERNSAPSRRGSGDSMYTRKAYATREGAALGQSATSSEIAPNGELRYGSVAVRAVAGVAEPVSKFIAAKLGVSVQPIMYPNPEAFVRSFGKDEWDIAIGPRASAVANKADLGADVWLIDLIYVAAPGHAFADASKVDRPGVR